jgi:hypothetical protein
VQRQQRAADLDALQTASDKVIDAMA